MARCVRSIPTKTATVRAENRLVIAPAYQLATAERFLEMGQLAVAFDEIELTERLKSIDEIKTAQPIGPFASEELIGAVRGFIDAA